MEIKAAHALSILALGTLGCMFHRPSSLAGTVLLLCFGVVLLLLVLVASLLTSLLSSLLLLLVQNIEGVGPHATERRA